jgi:predicted nucleic-acid-binding protein
MTRAHTRTKRATLFLDKSVFSSYLTESDTPSAKAAASVFLDAVEGKVTLCTSPLVIVQLIWLFHNPPYSYPKDRLQPIMQSILDIVDFPERDTCQKALNTWIKQDVDYVDAYNEIAFQEIKEAAS